ncbi:GNAT family N-acetyltransferase [Paenibacillus ginsengarvi]|uniref:N-acetyltransferase n=1 Tax=Paenibacillus ginsengarvi TaxID=400777 RepID=A0A3B0C887_9BACL|nr:GNAT family N-acetyltransferase [Paenibacillus ginsengarvi]RKN82245.1 N-acetyltransferase [Paenibacillus ginsengarvi]
MTLYISIEPNEADKAFVRDGMIAYNRRHFPERLRGNYREVAVFVKDAEGRTCGGLVGEICWNWLEVQYLFIEEPYRKSGYGAKLVREAERIARAGGCDFMKLDTLSFQAPEFYTKIGFEVYGTIPNAGGYTHYYMKKDLHPEEL